MFHLGIVYAHKQMCIEENILTDSKGLSDSPLLTLEMIMFPLLFVHSRGFEHQGQMSFTEYMKQRTQQLFSIFNLYKLS